MRIALAVVPWSKMKSSYSPLGLGYLAAVAEAEGHEVKIFDFGLTPEIKAEEAVERLSAFGPDVLGVSVTTNGYAAARMLAREFRKESAKPVVFGGPHSSLFPLDCLNDADYVIAGEGEHSFAQLLRVLGRRDSVLETIPGLFWRTGGGCQQGPPAARIDDLDAVPLPARHLFQLKDYPLAAEDGRPMTNMMTSRGCPYNCSYCYKGIFGNRCRTASPATILHEVRQILSLGIDRIYFIDDLFTFDRRRVLEICRRFIEEDLNIRWQCLSRVDLVDGEVLELMSKAGCEVINYGIESGDPALLKVIGKKIDLGQVRKAIAATKGVGIKTKGYFMLGLPGDSEETMRRTIDFACDLELDDAMFSLTTPFPGSRLWETSGLQWDAEADRFADAGYYVDRPEKAGIFYNLSTVDDATLLKLMAEARDRFTEAARSRRLRARFGPGVGHLAAALARSGTLRQWSKRVLAG